MTCAPIFEMTSQVEYDMLSLELSTIHGRKTIDSSLGLVFLDLLESFLYQMLHDLVKSAWICSYLMQLGSFDDGIIVCWVIHYHKIDHMSSFYNHYWKFDSTYNTSSASIKTNQGHSLSLHIIHSEIKLLKNR